MPTKKKRTERGHRFAAIRHDRNITQAKFAQLFKTTAASISRYESGRMPPETILEKLTDLGYDVGWLLTGIGTMRQPLAPVNIMEVFENLSHGIMIIQNGIRIYVNPSLAHSLEYTPGELIGKKFGSAIQKDQRDTIATLYKTRQVPDIFELDAHTKSNRRIRLRIYHQETTVQGKLANVLITVEQPDTSETGFRPITATGFEARLADMIVDSLKKATVTK